MSMLDQFLRLAKPRKYELLKSDTVDDHGTTLYRIRALRNFGDVRKGQLGGYIEAERNLSQEGSCWVGWQ